MECIVFDTSFLINCARAKVDWFKEIHMKIGEFTIVIPSPVMEELEKLAKHMVEASVALQLLLKKKYLVVECDSCADESVIEVATSKVCWVASTDKEVRNRAKRVVTLRKGKHIIMEM